MGLLCLLAVGSIAAVFFVAGNDAGMRALGVWIVVGAVIQWRHGSVPYGWEDQPPSGYMTGWALAIFSLLLVCVGVGLVLFPGGPAKIFGGPGN